MLDNSLRGIGLFAMEVLHLISKGEKETLEDIKKHFEDEDLVDYLYTKYKNNFSVQFDNSIYNNSVINKYFANYTGYIDGNEERKYGILHEDQGLLLILSLLMDKVESESKKWTVE